MMTMIIAIVPMVFMMATLVALLSTRSVRIPLILSFFADDRHHFFFSFSSALSLRVLWVRFAVCVFVCVWVRVGVCVCVVCVVCD